MNKTKEIGNLGEDLACDFLKKKGYKIIERNVRLSNKELDIVAKKGNLFIFVEVKTRNILAPGEVENSMNSRKIHHLKKAVAMYISDKKIKPDNIRPDLICVDIDYINKIANIKHYIDIF